LLEVAQVKGAQQHGRDVLYVVSQGQAPRRGFHAVTGWLALGKLYDRGDVRPCGRSSGSLTLVRVGQDRKGGQRVTESERQNQQDYGVGERLREVFQQRNRGLYANCR